MENIVNEIRDVELEKVAGGNDGMTRMKVSGLKTGYLAVRSDAAYDDKNILGHLYNNEYVYATGRYCGDYVWVYAECKADYVYDCKAFSGNGWVNKNFLINA